MSLQTKIKVNKSPAMRNFRKAPSYSGVVQQAPKAAAHNSSVHNLRSVSRTRSSLLPVSVVNKTTSTKRKTPVDKDVPNELSSSPSEPPSLSKKSKKEKKDKQKDLLNGVMVPTDSQSGISSPQERVDVDVSHAEKEVGLYVNTSMTDSSSQIPLNPTTVTNDNHTQTDSTPVYVPPSSSRLPPSAPEDPWHLAFTELKSMGEQISKLDKIEKDVASLSIQLGGIVGRTGDLEGVTQDHSRDINSLKSDLSQIKSVTDKYDTSFTDLWSFANDIASKADQRIKEIKAAIQENIDRLDAIGNVKEEIRKQVEIQVREAFQANTGKLNDDNIKEEIKKQVEAQLKTTIHAAKIKWCSQTNKKEMSDVINRNTHHFQYARLQDYKSEDENSSAFSHASNFFKTKLKLTSVAMDVAYRLGQPPAPGSPYSRPIVVRFLSMADRNLVWRKRNDVPQEG